MATRNEASKAGTGRRLGRGLSGLISTAVSITLPKEQTEQGGGTAKSSVKETGVPRGTSEAPTPPASG
jgi:hypothetical protein